MDPSGLLQLPAQRFPELSDIVRREVESLLKSRDIANPSSQGRTDCLFATIEAYISLVLCLLPRLADRLAKGSLITEYINSQMAEVEDATDFSDLTPITHLCEKERGLRLLVERLQFMVEEFNNSATIPKQPPPIATQSPAPPQRFGSYPASPPLSALSPSIASPFDVTPLEIHPYSFPSIPDSPGIFNEGLDVPAGITYNISTSMDTPRRDPESSGMALEQSSTSMGLVDANHLGQRGKGRHTCPHAFQCTKGGVNADGTMVIFERNSTFRAHLQKHDRPFKCDLPGCTNSTGFARIDQLNRHKATARHR